MKTTNFAAHNRHQMRKHGTILTTAFALILLTACDAPSRKLGRGNATSMEPGLSLGVAALKEKAEQGNADAQNDLGFMYGNSQGVPQDDKKAVMWYRKAADQGLASAQHNVASMYLTGLIDLVEAHMWYSLAADRGHTTSAATRDFIANRMSSTQIAEAQDRSAKWRQKKAAGK